MGKQLELDHIQKARDSITELKTTFTKLHARMDVDKDHYRQKNYVLLDENGRRVPKVENVTRNAPAALANLILGKLIKVTPRWEIRGLKLDDEQTGYIERFADDLMLSLDQHWKGRDIPSAKFYTFQQLGLRGRAAARVALRKNSENRSFSDKLLNRRVGKLDIAPMDTRWLSYEMGDGKLSKFVFELIRSPRLIREINDTFIKKAEGPNVRVDDYWDSERNITFLGSAKFEDKKNIYGYPAAVISLVPLGEFFNDSDNLQYRAESVFGMLRKTFDDMNKQATIISTINMRSLKDPQILTGNQQDEYPTIPEEDPTATGQITAMKAGEKMEPLKAADINQAAQVLFRIHSLDEQKGGLPDTSFGRATGDQSALAIKELAEAEGTLMTPLLFAYGEFVQDLVAMVINQMIALKLNMELGREGYENPYEWSKLQGKYNIHAIIRPVDPVQDVANLAIAETAKSIGLSQDTIMRDILKVENPAGEIAKRDDEELERSDPVVKLYRLTHSLITQREKSSPTVARQKDLEARRTAQKCLELIVDERQAKVGQRLPNAGAPAARERGPGGQLVSLLGRGSASTPVEEA